MLKNWVQRAEFNERWTHSQQPTHCSPLNHRQPGHRPPAFPVASLPPPALLYSTNSESLGIVCLQSLRILSLTQIVSLSARIELSQSDSRIGIVSRKEKGEMANLLYVRAELSADLNKNTEWFAYPGVWTTYILIVFFFWMTVLSLLGCSFGMAWTIVNVGYFFVTYHFFHWKKGTPFADEQGIYNGLTWWEQIDNGKQLTRNRKFLTIVPVVLYLISSHTTDYHNPMLFFNTLAVFVLVVAKFPHMHKVRLFGINGDH